MKKYGKDCVLHFVSKNIFDVIDCNLKKNYQILMIVGTTIPQAHTTGPAMTIQVPTSPKVCIVPPSVHQKSFNSNKICCVVGD